MPNLELCQIQISGDHVGTGAPRELYILAFRLAQVKGAWCRCRWTENPFSVLWQVPRKDFRHSVKSYYL